MIDIMSTVYTAINEYEMRYGKHPVLFINKSLYNYLTADKYLRDDLYLRYDNMFLCGYPVKLVLDDSDEMNFWVGEQKTIYGRENQYERNNT